METSSEDGGLVATPVPKPIIMFKFGTKEKPFRCQLCDMTFEDGDSLRVHTSKHAVEAPNYPEKPYPCKICPKTFKSAKTLERHVLVHYGQSVKRCKFCYKLFSNKENLEQHMVLHAGKKPHVCPICKEQFIYKQGLETHLMIHTGARPFVCHVCEKGFNRKDILDRHMHIHTGGNKNFKCVECDKLFSHSFVLKRHARAIHSGEDTGVECKECGKYIKSKENMSRHLKTHTGERPYDCEICGKRFTQKAHVKEHLLIHSNTSPYVCLICSEAFRHKRSLARHSYKHTGVRPWMCDLCDATFTEKSCLNKHVQQHNEKKHQCEICKTLFKRRISLRKHMENIHENTEKPARKVYTVPTGKVYINKAVQHNGQEQTENPDINQDEESDDQIIVIVLDNKDMHADEKQVLMEQLKTMGQKSLQAIGQRVERGELVSKQNTKAENTGKNMVNIVKVNVSNMEGFQKMLVKDIGEKEAPSSSQEHINVVLAEDDFETETEVTTVVEGNDTAESVGEHTEESVEADNAECVKQEDMAEGVDPAGDYQVEEIIPVEESSMKEENMAEDQCSIEIELVDDSGEVLRREVVAGGPDNVIHQSMETSELENRSHLLQTLIDYAESQIRADEESSNAQVNAESLIVENQG